MVNAPCSVAHDADAADMLVSALPPPPPPYIPFSSTQAELTADAAELQSIKDQTAALQDKLVHLKDALKEVNSGESPQGPRSRRPRQVRRASLS